LAGCTAACPVGAGCGSQQRGALARSGSGATTVSNFLAAATGSLLTEGRAQRAGRSLIFAEGEVRDADGTLLAKASGTFKLLYPKGNEA
jgi:acyl-coenzyme A thioesterase PaaI-like protein